MFVRKNLLVLDAQVTQQTRVLALGVAFEVLPARAQRVAVGFGALEAEKQDSIVVVLLGLEVDGEFLVHVRQLIGRKGAVGLGII